MIIERCKYFHYSALILWLCISVMAMTGCNTVVPSLHVWRPWVKTYETPSEPPIGSKLATEVRGTTEPLLGDELLRSKSIKSKMDYLFERRGYVIDNDKFDYRVSIIYRTERANQLSITSNTTTSNMNFIALLAGFESRSNYGLGVRIAKAVEMAAQSALSMASTKVEGTTSYIHTLAFEIYTKEDSLIWKSESFWGAIEPDIETNIITAMQIVLSGLPYNSGLRAIANEVYDSLASNYYRLYCSNKWFACPALPYRISFEGIDKYKDFSGYPSSVKNPYAFPAFVDLIQMAEYALPIGDKWADPLKSTLWSKVQLGGQYLLGAENKPINIMVELSGKSDGYIIKKCWIASEDEFGEFQSNMTKWRKTLINFYDVYKK